ncbi:Uncharacterized protein TCAP_05565 [Tolypocladium capitatum]|uniref:Myb-like DNA-binding protein myb-1 n=1 Tax=Tolypocladium capitatum TaxID=45235 RepID=A0A2K3QAC3_9HYPO|nr:Uncharacterized protein TCAP_05565 [Tolypocladium capitatum]
MAFSRRGPWSNAEDSYLMELVQTHGPLNWVRIAQTLGSRTPKQCRERYHQNLKPTLNHEPITSEEGVEIERLVQGIGKRWAEIARRLQGRSDNAVKNWWNGSQNRRKRLDRRRTITVQSPTTAREGGGGAGRRIAIAGAGAGAGAGASAAHHRHPLHRSSHLHLPCHLHPPSHLQPPSHPHTSSRARALLGDHGHDDRRRQPASMASPGAPPPLLPRSAEGHGQNRHLPWAEAPLPSPCSSELAESDTGSNYTTSSAGSSRPLDQRPILPPLRDWQLSNSGGARLPILGPPPSPAPPAGRLESRPRPLSRCPRIQLPTAPSSPMQGQGWEQQQQQQGEPDASARDRDSRMSVTSLLA